MGPAGTLLSAGGFDAFAVRLLGDTGVAKCAQSAGDESAQSGVRVAADSKSGNEYLLGTFLSSIDWGGGVALSGSPSDSQTYLVSVH
jgi:hypothetical protein